jgi:hypothetical protein
MVRYTVEPDRAAENEELVRGVFDELVRTRPEGLRFVPFELPDGVGFLHLAEPETAAIRCRACRRSSTSAGASPTGARPRSRPSSA